MIHRLLVQNQPCALAHTIFRLLFTRAMRIFPRAGSRLLALRKSRNVVDLSHAKLKKSNLNLLNDHLVKFVL
jgi:hypothetical protein